MRQQRRTSRRTDELEADKAGKSVEVHTHLGYDPYPNPIFDASDGTEGEQRIVDISGEYRLYTKLGGTWQYTQYVV